LAVTAEMVKQLREETGAGVMECKKALVEANGDINKAKETLRQSGLARAEKKSSRVAAQGLIEPYIHGNGRIGVLIELNCESDFVARTEAFRALAHDIAMQVAATSPKYVGVGDVPAEETAPKEEICLLAQPFIKNPGQTIDQLIKEKIGTIGENIVLRRFTRFELGESQKAE
jgi:elongation factor Ts